MIRKALLAAALLCTPALAFAQATYPTPAGSRVNGVVPLACDTNGANCSPSVADSAGTVVSSTKFWTESTTPLGASAGINGTQRDNGGVSGGASSRYAFFTGAAYSDQIGTLFIDKSVDAGVTWRQEASIATVAGSATTLKVQVTAASYRVRFANGATPQTQFVLTSAYSLN